jgi:hypothetical protein
MIFGVIILTLAAIATNVGGILSTERGLARGTNDKNPIARCIFERTGVGAAWWLEALRAVVLVVLWFRPSLLPYCISAGAMTAAGAHATWHKHGVVQHPLARPRGPV